MPAGRGVCGKRRSPVARVADLRTAEGVRAGRNAAIQVTRVRTKKILQFWDFTVTLRLQSTLPEWRNW